jgi:hypothetical protein
MSLQNAAMYGRRARDSRSSEVLGDNGSSLIVRLKSSKGACDNSKAKLRIERSLHRGRGFAHKRTKPGLAAVFFFTAVSAPGSSA